VKSLAFATLAAALASGMPFAPAQTATVLRDSGPRDSCLNVTILGDGYTAAEEAKFVADASEHFRVLIEDQALAPFASVINGLAIFTASAESGADIPSEGVVRDTCYNASFDVDITRLLTIDTSIAIDVLARFAPDSDITLALVNTPIYGGSGGWIAVTSLDEYSRLVALHEIGHSFANLADEYVDWSGLPKSFFSPQPNTTDKTTRDAVPWGRFIAPGTPLPSTGQHYLDFVGLFDGVNGFGYGAGIYRPTCTSLMRQLDAGWGPVNLRAFATAVHRLDLHQATASPTIATHPASATVARGAFHTLSVAVSGTGPFSYQWSRDGVFMPFETSPSLVLGPMAPESAGSYAVEVTNARGSVESAAARIDVDPRSVSVAFPAGQGSVRAGQTTVLGAVFSGASDSTRYQWRHNGAPIAGATEPEWAIEAARASDAGWYDVVVTEGSWTFTGNPSRLVVHPPAYPDTLREHDGAYPVFEVLQPTGRQVTAVCASGNKICVAVESIEAGAASESTVARFGAGGEPDTGFVPCRFGGGSVRALAIQSDGRIVAGGSFTNVEGAPRRGIARLEADGALDGTFAAAGTGADDAVQAVAVQPDGRILVAGWFLQMHGVQRSRIARLQADGSLDLAFESPPSLFAGEIQAIACQPDGRIVAGIGQGSTAFGPINLVRLAPDGSRDDSFLPANAGFYGPVLAVAIQPDGAIVAAGGFTATIGSPRSRIARFDASGNLDPSFGAGGGFDATVTDIALLSDGGILAVGAFDTFGSTSCPRIARLLPNGTLDSSFREASAGRITFDGGISKAAVLEGGGIVAIGGITAIDGLPRFGIAKFDGRGAPDPAYTPGPRMAAAAAIHAIEPYPDGGYIVGGRFDCVDGLPFRNLARLRPDGSVDTAFRSDSDLDGVVEAIGVARDGSIVIGGSFTRVGGLLRPHIAWLAPSGSPLPGFPWPAAFRTTEVHTIAMQPDDSAVVGGSLFDGEADGASRSVVRLRRNGMRDRSFGVESRVSESNVRALAIQPDGKIIVGIGFDRSTPGVVTKTLVRLLPNGIADPGFHAGLSLDSEVCALALQPDGKIVVGGRFSRIGGVARQHLARLQPDGSVDLGFDPRATLAGAVRALLVQADGRIVAGCERAGESSSLVRLEPDGSLDGAFVPTSLQGNLRHTVCALACDAHGLLLAGQAESSIGCGLAVLESAAAPSITAQPAAPAAKAGEPTTFSVAATGAGPLAYQWCLDGLEIPGATSPTYSVPCAQTFHAGLYSVVVSSVGGHATPSIAASLAVDETPTSDARLLNLSTRGLCLAGDDRLVPGFVIAGEGSLEMLVRTVGPSLKSFGLSDLLPDPSFVLARKDGGTWTNVGTNDDWSSSIAPVFGRLGAFPLPEQSLDAALVAELPAGVYSVVAGDDAQRTGLAIVELYSGTASGGSAHLVNISTRGFVGPGDNVMIPGFVVSEEGPRTFLVRAVGPTLSQFQVPGVLADPQIAVHRRIGNQDQTILRNDDWGIGADAGRTAREAARTGAFALPPGSKDAAFVVTLPPGIYTVVTSGVGGATGIALVEIYLVP
jgi:uncharacterized delta-60 repeat protein